jgi:hypothetical protein
LKLTNRGTVSPSGPARTVLWSCWWRSEVPLENDHNPDRAQW